MTKETRATATTLSPLPVLATILCSALLLVAISMPYLVITFDFYEFYGSLGMESISLYRLARQTWAEGTPQFTYVLCAYAAFSALALLMSVLKKPVGVLIFDALAMAFATLTHVAYASSGAVRNEYYVFGFGDKLIFIAGIVLFVCAIWLLVVKVKIKKARKQRAEVTPKMSNHSKERGY